MNPDPAFTPHEGLLRDLLESEKTLRQAIEAEARGTRQALETLARELAPDLADRLTKQSTAGLAGVSPDALAAQISQHLRGLLARARTGTPATAAPDGEALRQLQAALAEQDRTLQSAQTEIHKLTARVAQLEQEKADLLQRAAAPPAAQPPTPPAAPIIKPATTKLSENPTLESPEIEAQEPEETLVKVNDFRPAAPPEFWPAWFEEWVKSRGFGNDFLIVKALGETGEPTRVRLLRLIAQQLQFAEVPGSLGRAATRLHELGLIRILPVLKQTRQGGTRKVHMLHLTDPAGGKNGSNGLDAYRLLFGKDAVRQDAAELFSRHKAAEHAYLILETQAILEKAGFTVERFPDPFEVPDFGRYEPDLTAGYEGKTIYIEVERGAFKNEPKREIKFRRYWEVSEGQFWIATDTNEAAKALTSEIAFQSGNLKRQVRLRLLIVESIAPDAVPQGWDLWPPEQVF